MWNPFRRLLFPRVEQKPPESAPYVPQDVLSFPVSAVHAMPTEPPASAPRRRRQERAAAVEAFVTAVRRGDWITLPAGAQVCVPALVFEGEGDGI